MRFAEAKLQTFLFWKPADGYANVNNDPFSIDLTKLDPVIYSGMYHSIGRQLGKTGDFAE